MTESLDTRIAALTNWSREDATLTRTVRASSFPEGIDLVRRVADAAEERDHHPDIDIRYTTITFRLTTHSEGGLTDKDVDLARAIDALV